MAYDQELADTKRELREVKAENLDLRKQVEKLRTALAPFACLGMGEVRVGDFNRARRALQ